MCVFHFNRRKKAIIIALTLIILLHFAYNPISVTQSTSKSIYYYFTNQHHHNILDIDQQNVQDHRHWKLESRILAFLFISGFMLLIFNQWYCIKEYLYTNLSRLFLKLKHILLPKYNSSRYKTFFILNIK